MARKPSIDEKLDAILGPLVTPASAPAPPARFPRPYRAKLDPEPGLCSHLEKLLADARAGKLRAIAYGAVYRDDLSPAGLVDHGYCCGSGTYYAMSHAIARLERGWGRECDTPDKQLDRWPPTQA